MADKIFVEHSGQHEPTSKQLRDAGVDLDKVSGYVNSLALERPTPSRTRLRPRSRPAGTDQAQPS